MKIAYRALLSLSLLPLNFRAHRSGRPCGSGPQGARQEAARFSMGQG